ncbi:MAG: phospholipid/cholesterol/gamma-HCH transport system substrate-binding protein [Mycobacterium sp.]|jgi:phospholipid/cholesterol/gamma-HCH transport system substrate-binding protein|nr:phospholipid/cholesterol/gamma-HCH transport system substrate-binding protein [Mycobacterium sp.]
MRSARLSRIGIAAVLAVCLVAGLVIVLRVQDVVSRVNVVAYFDNSNGIFVGDDVVILGVPVGKIEKIEPQPERAKISFWYDDKYKVPADAQAAIISPAVVTPRAIQLLPAYNGGAALSENAVIPLDRTAVPVEYDDLRQQLEKLTQTLQPTEPGGVSTLGAFINTAADNLRGQGANIRESLIRLSKVFSTLGDHSDDIFGTVKSLAALVSALQDSAGILRQLNGNLSAVTGLLANDPNEVGDAVKDLNDVVGDVGSFVRDNRESLGTTSDKLGELSQTLVESLPDIKQTLHVAPTAFQNFANIYEPANAALTGALALNNFANPISFICGAIQAASRLGGEQSAKLCAQYLAPIVKNRQYNFLPFGEDFFVGAQARPNEITYSEDFLRPSYGPNASPPPADAPPQAAGPPPAADTGSPVYPAEAKPTDPAAGLPGMMTPGGGS